MKFKKCFKTWIPAFAGMTTLVILLSSCGPTYNRETMKQSIKDLAKKEYKLDVEVKEAGDTLGVRYEVKNFLGELVASDQMVWEHIEDLMMVLSRVALSSDRPPKFLVLDIVDAEHHSTHLIFTRYIQDLQKIMAEAQSRTDFLDRLLIEFETNGVRSIFDPLEMDIVRLMMMTSESMNDPTPGNPEFVLKEVQFPDFLANVAANSLRRQLKEKEDKSDQFVLRQVAGFYVNQDPSTFRFQLDIIPRKETTALGDMISKNILPFVAEEAGKIFKSYKFDQFSLIKVIEKNSGQLLTVPQN